MFLRRLKFELVQIGCVHSPYVKKDAPRQSKLKDTVSQIEIFDEYLSAMQPSDLTHYCSLLGRSRRPIYYNVTHTF